MEPTCEISCRSLHVLASNSHLVDLTTSVRQARRMMRLIEQHQQFVKDVKSRKPIDMSAIPDLPGKIAYFTCLLANITFLAGSRVNGFVMSASFYMELY